jgi:hypothetical protein
VHRREGFPFFSCGALDPFCSAACTVSLSGEPAEKEDSKLSATTTEADREFVDFVDHYLVVSDAKCYRHCQEPVKFVPIFIGDASVAGAYICPSYCISRVVYFANHPDRQWFETFLSSQVGSMLRSRDIRVATRHGWELGSNAEVDVLGISDTGDLKQYYWTFYPKTDAEKIMGAFICSNCGNLFTKNFSDESTLCPKCAAKVS